MTDEAKLYEMIVSECEMGIDYDGTSPIVLSRERLQAACADLERGMASQIAANATQLAQLQEQWLRINELERNNALMAERLMERQS